VWVAAGAVPTGTPTVTEPAPIALTPTPVPLALAAEELKIEPSPTPAFNVLGRESLTTSTVANFVPPSGTPVTVNALNVTELRTAISTANQNCYRTTIINLTGTSPYIVNDAPAINNFYGANGFPVIRCDIVIQGNAKIIQRLASSTTTGPLFRLFAVDDNQLHPFARLTLDNVTVRYGLASATGGSGVFSLNGTLHLRNNARIVYNILNISNPTNAMLGAGLYSSGGRVLIEDSYIANNSNTSTIADGGGVAMDGGLGIVEGIQLIIRRTTIENNSARRHGSGIHVGYINGANITQTNIRNNTVVSPPTSTRNGSAIFFSESGNSVLSAVCINGNTEIIASGKLAVVASNTVVTAANTWWGATSGPRHPSNPAGTGQAASSNINIGTPPNFITTNPGGAHNCIAGGLNAVGHRNRDLNDPNSVFTVVPQVNYNWGGGNPIPPFPGLTQADNFSVRFYGSIVPTTTASYRLWTNSDDGVILWWYSGGTWQKLIDNPNTYVGQAYTNYFTLTAGQRYPIVLDYFEIGGNANIQLQWQVSTSSSVVTIPQANLSTSIAVDLPEDGVCSAGAAPAGGISPLAFVCQNTSPSGLLGLYYSDRNFQNYVTSRIEDVNFDDNNPSWPPSDLSSNNRDNYSVVWSGKLIVPQPGGQTTICSEADDGIRVYLDDILIINNWGEHAVEQVCVGRNLSPGPHDIYVQYFEATGYSVARLKWRTSPLDPLLIPIPTSSLQPALNIPSTLVNGGWSNSFVPFTSTRLRDFARNYPNSVWSSQIPPTYPSVTWNRDVGRYFEDRIVRLASAIPNNIQVSSPSRGQFTNFLYTTVVPDGYLPVIVRIPDDPNTTIDESLTPISFPTSGLLEVKATNSNMALSYRNYQLAGMMSAARTQTTLGQQYDIGVFVLIMTADARISYNLIAEATRQRTLFCVSTVWEIPGSTPDQSHLFINSSYLVNPEVIPLIAPVRPLNCPVFSAAFTISLSGTVPSPVAGDPDPAELEIN
jgi:PA14 domain